MKKSNQNLHQVPAMLPELPTKSSGTSPPNAGTQKIQTPLRDFKSDCITYEGKISHMLNFKVGLDRDGKLTAGLGSSSAMLIANGFAPYDKFMVVGGNADKHAPIRAVNLPDQDIPRPLLEKIVAAQCSHFLGELHESLRFEIVDLNQYSLAPCLLYIEDMALPIGKRDIPTIIEALGGTIEFLEDEADYLELCRDEGDDLLGELKHLLAMAKAVDPTKEG